VAQQANHQRFQSVRLRIDQRLDRDAHHADWWGLQLAILIGRRSKVLVGINTCLLTNDERVETH
jgi:hypothetical protein